MRSIIIDGVLIEEGQVVHLSQEGQEGNFGRAGTCATVRNIYESNMGELPRIAVVREGLDERWGDLGGEVDDHTGLVFRATNFLKYFDTKVRYVVVKKYTTAAGVKMDGKRGVLLAYMSDGEHCFVEFDENIGGGSADGLGKNGHCLLLNHNAIKSVHR